MKKVWILMALTAFAAGACKKCVKCTTTFFGVTTTVKECGTKEEIENIKFGYMLIGGSCK